MSMRARALRAEARVRAHGELGELRFGLRLALEQRADHGAEEAAAEVLKMPGFSSGKIASALPMMLGEIAMSTSDEASPVPKPHTAPVVLKRLQKSDSTMTGRFADAATANASATRNATFAVGPSTIAITRSKSRRRRTP